MTHTSRINRALTILSVSAAAFLIYGFSGALRANYGVMLNALAESSGIDYASVSGAFISGWLGGILLEKTGGYDLIWISSMVLSLLAGLLATRVKEESDS